MFKNIIPLAVIVALTLVANFFTKPSFAGGGNFKNTAAIKTIGPFGSVSIPFTIVSSAPKWNAANRSIRSKVVLDCRNTASCVLREKRVARILQQGEKKSFYNKLKLINSQVNKLVYYQSDLQTYRQKDHWAAPDESLRSGVGDCEDYAILKMALLQKLGIPAKAMSLVVLKDTKRNLYHAVLAVSTNKGTFILDNVQPKVMKDHQLPHYLPLYSFSENRSWIHGWKTVQKRQLALTKSINIVNILPGSS